jgi:Cu/Ag efflux protein CusF
MKHLLLAVSLFGVTLIPIACSRSNQSAENEKRYPMTGEVLSLDAKDQTATIKAGPITGWMDAMTMEFPIQSKSDFDSLRVGEKIKATVDVKGGTDYSLANVQAQSSPK